MVLTCFASWEVPPWQQKSLGYQGSTQSSHACFCIHTTSHIVLAVPFFLEQMTFCSMRSLIQPFHNRCLALAQQYCCHLRKNALQLYISKQQTTKKPSSSINPAPKSILLAELCSTNSSGWPPLLLGSWDPFANRNLFGSDSASHWFWRGVLLGTGSCSMKGQPARQIQNWLKTSWWSQCLYFTTYLHFSIYPRQRDFK